MILIRLVVQSQKRLFVQSDFTIFIYLSFLMEILLFLVYSQYFNQILTVVLEVVDDEDLSVREVALSLISEMLKSQVCYFSH